MCAKCLGVLGTGGVPRTDGQSLCLHVAHCLAAAGWSQVINAELSVNCVVTRSKPERDVGPVVSNWVGREDLHDERTLGQTLKEVKEGAMQLWGSSYRGAETVA